MDTVEGPHRGEREKPTAKDRRQASWGPRPPVRATAATYRNLGWSHVQRALAEAASTDFGRQAADELFSLASPAAVRDTLAQVESLRPLLATGRGLPLAGCPAAQVTSSIRRCEKGAVLDCAELLACVKLMRLCDTLRHYCQASTTALGQPGEGLPRFGVALSQVSGVLDEQGGIRDDASVVLEESRARAKSLHVRLRQRLERLLNDDSFNVALQDSYFTLRNGRYVLPVNTDFSGKVPGIVHDASQTEKTIFVEPQAMVAMGNDLAIAESLAAEEERRIRSECSEALSEVAAQMHSACAHIGRLDLLQARATLAETLACAVPELVPQAVFGGIDLRQFRHPLLLLQGKAVVANSIELGDECRCLVLSGPNAGGKTVAMTGVGLVALMLWAGLPIPVAKASRMSLFHQVHCVIGDAQDVSDNQSTFSAHLTALKSMLLDCGDASLYLVDEIASGTDPVEGAAIAQAILEDLVGTPGARTVVTTHLEAVKALAITDSRFANGSFSLDKRTRTPRFELVLGLAGVSNALEVAQTVGLPDGLLTRAQGLLETSGALSVALHRLEEQNETMRQAVEQAETEGQIAGQLRLKLQTERAALAQERQHTEAQVRQAMAAELEATQRQVSSAIAALQKQQPMNRLQEQQRQLQRAAEEQQRQARDIRSRQQLEHDGLLAIATPHDNNDRQAVAEVGQQVHVVTLGQSGVVSAIEGDDVIVRVGNLKTRVPASALHPIRKGSGGKRDKPPVVPTTQAPTTAAQHRCDLRGMRADDAQRTLDIFLDQAFLRGPAEVVVVHGHGQGILKSMARQWLETCAAVTSFRPGKRQEGGDGVTIVLLKNA